jgi:flagellar M-ring protein FliF
MNALVQGFRGIGSVRYVTLGVTAVLLLTIFGFLSLRLTSPVMSTLYSNLSQDDSSSVVTELGALGVKFDVGSGGSEILVESAEVLKVRMMLAEKGLPSRGSVVGYEIFDKESALGTSNFVLNVNLIRALEGELSRTIGSLSSIKSARVHIVMPNKNAFERKLIEPSASVVITLNNRLDVPKEEAVAVRHLVSSSVPGLKPSRVTIVDSNGKVLAKAKSDDDEGEMGTAAGAADYKTQTEERYRKMVNNLLEEAVGSGKVDAQVSVELSFDKVTTSSEVYDPDGAVVRSTQTSEESNKAKGGAGGDVSVANELTGDAAAAGGGSSEDAAKTNETTNFEISKTITNKVSEVGTVKRLSIAVLVDGVYTKDADGKDVYNPRTDEEMDKIRSLVQSAVGYKADRGDTVSVVNMQFNRNLSELISQEGPMDWLKRDLDSIIKTVVVGIVAILGIMLVIRPLVNKAFDLSSVDLQEEELKMMAAAEQAAAISASSGMSGGGGSGVDDKINLDMIQTKVDNTPTKRVNDLIDNNPEETLSVIRSWMAQNK